MAFLNNNDILRFAKGGCIGILIVYVSFLWDGEGIRCIFCPHSHKESKGVHYVNAPSA